MLKAEVAKYAEKLLIQDVVIGLRLAAEYTWGEALLRKHRIAVGNNLKNKIAEIGFFLRHILRVCEIIRMKHVLQNYPINVEVDELNYFFSAFLNSIQSLKDASQTAMDISTTWEDLSPTYGKFIYYCRTATTHDGSQMINAGQGLSSYIVGPLQRVDNKGLIKENIPPREDIATLSRNVTREILQNVRCMLEKNGMNIPSPTHADLAELFDASMSDDFAPDFVKKMRLENRDKILLALSNAKFDYAKDALKAIDNLQVEFGFVIS